MNKNNIKVLKEMNIKPTKKNFNKLNDKKLFTFNSKMQLLRGEEKYDYFTISDLGEDTDISKLGNLLEWDKKNWKFQKKHGMLGLKKYEHLYMSGTWVRACPMDDYVGSKRHFIYATVESANSYITTAVNEKLNDALDKMYPCIYSRPYGTKMFSKIKNSKFSRLTKTEKRCGGFKKEREKLEKAIQNNWYNIEKEALKELAKYESRTFKIIDDKLGKFDNNTNFIIGGKKAARAISFQTFFTDFYRLEEPGEIINQIIERVFEKYLVFIFNYEG